MAHRHHARCCERSNSLYAKMPPSPCIISEIPVMASLPASACTVRSFVEHVPPSCFHFLSSMIRSHLFARLLVRLSAALLIVSIVSEPRVFAAEEDKDKEKNKPAEKDEKNDKETKSVTEGEVVIAGQKINYTATAGTLPLTRVDG